MLTKDISIVTENSPIEHWLTKASLEKKSASLLAYQTEWPNLIPSYKHTPQTRRGKDAKKEHNLAGGQRAYKETEPNELIIGMKMSIAGASRI